MFSLVFIYACLCAYAYWGTDRQIFLPQPSSYRAIAELATAPGDRPLQLTSSQNHQIAALYLPNPTAAYTILHSHGNAEDLGDVDFILRKLRRLGFAVFAYDYQGYGQSQGKPSETNSYADISAAYYYMTGQLGIPAQKILVYGRSIGSGPSTWLASQKPTGGLILESPLMSVFRVFSPLPLFPFDKFPNLERIKSVRVPVLVMHGKLDEVIPFQHGLELFNRAAPPKQSLWLENAGHNDLIMAAGIRYEQALKDFMQLVQGS
jgi:fermentation-respiration switch protein FrsA (DUF1100 family)